MQTLHDSRIRLCIIPSSRQQLDQSARILVSTFQGPMRSLPAAFSVLFSFSVLFLSRSWSPSVFRIGRSWSLLHSLYNRTGTHERSSCEMIHWLPQKGGRRILVCVCALGEVFFGRTLQFPKVSLLISRREWPRVWEVREENRPAELYIRMLPWCLGLAAAVFALR